MGAVIRDRLVVGPGALLHLPGYPSQFFVDQFCATFKLNQLKIFYLLVCTNQCLIRIALRATAKRQSFLFQPRGGRAQRDRALVSATCWSLIWVRVSESHQFCRVLVHIKCRAL
jgi:hypothetical protein